MLTFKANTACRDTYLKLRQCETKLDDHKEDKRICDSLNSEKLKVDAKNTLLRRQNRDLESSINRLKLALVDHKQERQENSSYFYCLIFLNLLANKREKKFCGTK